MRNMNLLKLIVGAFLGFGVALSSHAALKLGYVDMNRAIQSTSTGKNAKSRLEKEFKKKKQELDKKKADLEKMQKDLEKKAMALSEDVRKKKQIELQQEFLKFREMASKSQMEITKKERNLTLPIVKKLREILAKVAKKEKYDFILEKSEQSVLWAKKDLDLTERLVKEYEKQK